MEECVLELSEEIQSEKGESIIKQRNVFVQKLQRPLYSRCFDPVSVEHRNVHVYMRTYLPMFWAWSLKRVSYMLLASRKAPFSITSSSMVAVWACSLLFMSLQASKASTRSRLSTIWTTAYTHTHTQVFVFFSRIQWSTNLSVNFHILGTFFSVVFFRN